MKLELAGTINKLVDSKYLLAKSSESLVFSHTELTIIRSRAGVPFQLRYCPALSRKPVASISDVEGPKSTKVKSNPFENPAEDLLVARLPNERNATHNLVLNKYPVIHRHSILSTIGFKKQTDILESQDLDVTYSCLQAWESGTTEGSPSRLFAFFNSGEHSGASQPHRHLQLLPIEDMVSVGSPRAEWQPLIDLMTEPFPDNSSLLRNPSLSFHHYALTIPENPGTGVLQGLYHRLYDCASRVVQAWNEGRPSEQTAVDSDNGEATISYNLAMTTRTMAICPRRKETARIPTYCDEGAAAVNGTILGGTLMVKELQDWEAVRQNHFMIDDILAEIGIPFSRDLDNLSSTRL